MTKKFRPLVLIHGAWHGKWCWKKLRPLLKEEGIPFVTFDLPGHGKDPRSIAEMSVEDYIQETKKHIDQLDEKPILLGHSMGGTIISHIAERWPDSVHSLVYLAAILLKPGEDLFSNREHNSKSLLGKYRRAFEDPRIYGIDPEGAAECLYNCCEKDDAQMAKANLCPASMKASKSQMKITDENYGRVPRYYIQCMKDRCITPEFQEWMVGRFDFEKTYKIEADHSAFLSRPKELLEILKDISKQ